MKSKIISIKPISTFSFSLISFSILILAGVTDASPFAYITNYDNNSISVIDTATNEVTATVNVGNLPTGVAGSPDGKKVYVVNFGKSPDYKGTISVIDTATNDVTDTVKVESAPQGIAVSPDGTKVYVVNSNIYPYYKDTIFVIDTATNNVTDMINAGICPQGIAVTPDGNKVYVVNYGNNTTSVINTATNKVDATVPVGEYTIAVGLGPATKPNSTKESNSTSLINLINRTDNQTNDTGAAANAETVSTQKIESSPNKASIPFINPIWALVAMLGAVAHLER